MSELEVVAGRFVRGGAFRRSGVRTPCQRSRESAVEHPLKSSSDWPLLDTNNKPHLFRALEANNCNLFVGAGFSATSTSRAGPSIPMARGLAELLWEWMGLPGDYDGSELAIVYQAALDSGRPLRGLRELLERHLLAADVPAWFDLIPRIYWRRIYGTNVDNVLEVAYRRVLPAPSLEVISAPADEYRERDAFLERIQYIKLHGSLPGDPRKVTFGTLEFGRRANARDDWWHHFVRDYSFHTTVFVGSELNEPLFWQAIAARGPRGSNPEERPKSYLVIPQVSPPKLALLEGYNIVHVPGTAEQFFQWLTSEFSFPDREAVLATVAPESAEVLQRQGVSAAQRAALTEFLSTFVRVPLSGKGAFRSRVFLGGAPPTWADIAHDMDAPRTVNQELRTRIDSAIARPAEFAAIAVLGEGGAGKSTILRRVALSLRQDGQEVFSQMVPSGQSRRQYLTHCGPSPASSAWLSTTLPSSAPRSLSWSSP